MTKTIDSVDTVVIGAGVVGLAVARELAQSGREVIVLEAAEAFGTGISSRNSEVIHAGIYYATGSLKARLCVAGQRLLYDFCVSHGVAHQRCGKLIVATQEAQRPKLLALAAQAHANGVDDLVWLSGDEARALEPALRCVAALHSPSTGIVDSHGLMLALLGDAEAAGAALAVCSPVLQLEHTGEGWLVDVGMGMAGESPMRLLARTVVNAAGLQAPQLAQGIAALPPAFKPSSYFCKGNYVACAGKPAFSRLIYPIPEAAGLGVHVTLDLAGQMRFGPDVEWLDIATEAAIDYRVSPQRLDGMAEAIRRYWPDLPDDVLTPSYSGVRPKITGPEAAAVDFRIDGPADHGLPGLVNLLGIESPGLTSSLAIAAYVCSLLDGKPQS